MSSPRRRPSLEARFRELSPTLKTALSNQSPLRVGIATLTIAKEECGVEYLSVDEIVQALHDAGVAASPVAIQKAFSRGGNRIASRHLDGVAKYKVMVPGIQEVRSLVSEGNIELVHVEAGQPRTSRKKLSEILSGLVGIVRISDPYFGEHTLDALEAVPEGCQTKFMTARIVGDQAKLKRLTADLQVERPNLEVRLFPDPRKLHDRYVHSDAKLIIVGHGLKDIGNKESFVISVDETVARELIETIRVGFDSKWEDAAAF